MKYSRNKDTEFDDKQCRFIEYGFGKIGNRGKELYKLI